MSARCTLTILMPCLDEAETLATCIRKAYAYLDRANIDGEVLVADNGSRDGSVAIALAEGARVIHVSERGYGSALMSGIRAARGEFVVMGDADDSYDFSSLDPFFVTLRKGHDVVVGDRFAGGIRPGAMPWLHRWIGNPVLSFLARRFFRLPLRDFHCGLRAVRRDTFLTVPLHTTGMEWASEMIVTSALRGLSIAEVPTILSPDGRTRPPHLRSFSDGWRHLRFLVLYSPRWLFFYPGLASLLVGLVMTVALTIGPITIGGVSFDIGTLMYGAGLMILGYCSICFAVLSRAFAQRERFLPFGRRYARFRRWWSLERGIRIGLLLVLIGVLVAAGSLLRWQDAGFGELDGAQTVRTVIPAVLGMVLGSQTIFASLLLSMLELPTSRPVDQPTAVPQPPASGRLTA